MTFTIEAFQNRYLPPESDRVDAILSVTAPDAATIAPSAAETVIGFIVDTSGSMSGSRIEAVKAATAQAIDLLDPSLIFFVVTFQGAAQVICPPERATGASKAAAHTQLQRLTAFNGTAMSHGLSTARTLFSRFPDAIRQAIFLTDGKNESEQPAAVAQELSYCAGMFECDCWGVGTDWQVGEVQEIARALLGKAALIPDAAGIGSVFGAAVAKANAKATKDVYLRLWTPMNAEIVFVKQVYPTIVDLSNDAAPAAPQVRQYFTGAWAAGETRDFHVAVHVPTGNVGDEMLAARPSIAYRVPGPTGWVDQEDRPPTARLFATWTADDTLSSRLDSHVAHYTGQDELAQAIQEGLEKREQGDDAAATHLLGRAVQLAAASDNLEMTTRLTKVVDIVDALSGTVRLKRDATKAATMDLQLESTTTHRSRNAPAANGGNPS